MYTLRAIAFANGARCPHAGRFLRSFDFDAHNGRGHGTFSANVENAMRFETSAAAIKFWRTTSKVRPKRDDGKPNRPLTALTAAVERVE